MSGKVQLVMWWVLSHLSSLWSSGVFCKQLQFPPVRCSAHLQPDLWDWSLTRFLAFACPTICGRAHVTEESAVGTVPSEDSYDITSEHLHSGWNGPNKRGVHTTPIVFVDKVDKAGGSKR
eukprot:6470800-Amphidinium_carterae.1